MLFALAVQLLVTNPAQPVYNGRAGQTSLTLSRLVEGGRVDGELDEPAWARAALLTGFSLYQPVDGRPAPDSTEVLVWYSPTALHVGIRAFETHAPVHATLADRDKISGDDNVQLFLDTFDDHRRAYVFAVNPLGIQADGMRSEGSGAGLAGGTPGQTDLSPDFAFESKGRLTPWGYQVEMRIPFTSLRYPVGERMTWGINVQRVVQHSGYSETWTAVHRASASFLSESGTMDGIAGLQRGVVLEVNPEATVRTTGTPGARVTTADQGQRDAFRYASAAQLGGNVKYDLNSALTINGTIKPDFSQVEADATQIASDPRFDLYYAEKRPFFIDGIEQFDTPNRLVYTRRIVQPLVATKLTGTLLHTDVAFLSAADDRVASASGTDRPLFNILRLRRDLPAHTTLGLLYTGRTEGSTTNRVLSGDLHVVFAKLYYAQFQAARSTTGSTNVTRTSPLWEGIVDRTGRSFGFHYSLTGIGDDFIAASGFVARRGVVTSGVKNRVTYYGASGAMLENYTIRLSYDGVWDYRTFFRLGSALEHQGAMENVFTFRGGWNLTVAPLLSSYAFDPRRYAAYASINPATGDTLSFRVSPRIAGSTLRFSIGTPRFQHLSASVGGRVGRDVDFLETDPAGRLDYNALVDWLPTRQLRVHGSYVASSLRRTADGTRVASARIPRLAMEYQLARPLFVRLVGQYDAELRTPLIDYRTGAPLLIQTGGVWSAVPVRNSNDLRVDGLVAYQPTPGTVVFLGYGDSLREPDPLAFTRLRRTADAFFAKVSYAFR